MFQAPPCSHALWRRGAVRAEPRQGQRRLCRPALRLVLHAAELRFAVRRGALRCAALRTHAALPCAGMPCRCPCADPPRPVPHFLHGCITPRTVLPASVLPLQIHSVPLDPKEFAKRLWGDRWYNPGACVRLRLHLFGLLSPVVPLQRRGGALGRRDKRVQAGLRGRLWTNPGSPQCGGCGTTLARLRPALCTCLWGRAQLVASDVQRLLCVRGSAPMPVALASCPQCPRSPCCPPTHPAPPRPPRLTVGNTHLSTPHPTPPTPAPSAETRTFSKAAHAGGERTFVQFILEPLYKVYAQARGRGQGHAGGARGTQEGPGARVAPPRAAAAHARVPSRPGPPFPARRVSPLAAPAPRCAQA